MLSFNEVLERVEKEINLLSLDYSPKSLYTPIEYILSLGGKRIRPALTLIACNMYKEDITDAIKPALSLEIFHNFTLLHDDLMDAADKRRSKPTVHKVWGDNAAILSGDAMLIVAYQTISESNPQYLPQLLSLFTTTALEICGGQQFDMEFEKMQDVSEAEYIEMIRLKTAVLLACGLKMGAITGGASLEDADRLYEFGINIGLAFQLKDDLLDVYGDVNTFGKNIGGDILCNKKTFLLINALQKANKDQKVIFNEWFKKQEYDPQEKIQVFTSLYNELNIKEICEKKIEEYYTQAMIILNELQLPQEKSGVLHEVSEYLLHRNV